MSYTFNTVDPVKTIPGEGYKLVAQTMGDFYLGPTGEEEMDFTAACALHAGHDVQIMELRKPWWTWSHYFLYVKEVVNDLQEG